MYANYLAAESRAAELFGMKNAFYKKAIARLGKANAERHAKGKSEASEIEKDNEIMAEMERTGATFFRALQLVLVEFLTSLCADAHPDWMEEDALHRAYLYWLGDEEQKKEQKELDEKAKRKPLSLGESKALVKDFLRIFGGSTVEERDMIGPDEFCMQLEGRRMLSFLLTELGFDKSKECKKIADMLFRGRAKFVQVMRFPPNKSVLECALTGKALKEPEHAVAMLLPPRDKTQDDIFFGFLERNLALAMQTASFACDPAKNVLRVFKEFLRKVCQFKLVKHGTKAERNARTKGTGVFLQPTLVDRSQVELLVQEFCNGYYGLFGEYWDAMCVLKNARAKGRILHTVKVLPHLLNNEDEYGSEIMQELEKRRKVQE